MSEGKECQPDRQPRNQEIWDCFTGLTNAINLLGRLKDDIVDAPKQTPTDAPKQAVAHTPSLGQLLAELPKMIIAESERVRSSTREIRELIF